MELRLADFEGFVGEPHEIVFADGTLPVVLEKAQSLPRSMREAGPFRLDAVSRRTLARPGDLPFRRGERCSTCSSVPSDGIAAL